MPPLFLQINFTFQQYKIGILSFVTAFVVAMILMPLLIKLINRFKLYDVPDLRKEHSLPIPTMGGIAIFASMVMACLLWVPFSNDNFTICFFFSMSVLFAIGIMDDMWDVPANYKFAIQLAVALLIAFSGVRITSFNGLFGIYELPVTAQYTVTIIAIAGITNSFNLIDGIDGLAGGLGFMSLVTLGVFLTLCGDAKTAVVAFALAGGVLGFLYYNFNPARIFMGDTGSLVLGFAVAVLCIYLIRLNTGSFNPILLHTPVFSLSIVLIPVFDTLRVFALRIWKGKSPFDPDKTHIHHLLTNNGWSHSFASKLICIVHGGILVLGYGLHSLPQEIGLAVLLITMLLITLVFKKLRVPAQSRRLQLDRQ
jgi:UDP-N-acetylmuramyl pentapeptide phosphotransferase/UDP-N-acetylglucosamine-1-phosphate transferase